MKKNGDSKKDDDKILFAWLATFLSLVGFVIAIIARRKDKYVMYYAKQSIVIFIAGAIGGVIGNVLNIIPLMGTLVNAAIGVLMVIVWVVSWVYALSGREKKISIISDWAKKIRL
ncbi:MAG: hypothetical protein PHQ66_01895 [Candidatus Nanoarchaeia archaeon]|nr:hypothetical protein [Candidatus Nanoarchaeia archaeon]MDD5357874.1 hypothetical protein [Candidatus Nanoarchaeia archaeon]MDD5588793.1 hypothetical protein [Candidatus Nanoarchaeia archaeon]